MNNLIRPAKAIAPGRIILRELEARGWSQQDLASIIGRPQQMISEIIHAKKQITAETARQLAKAFGTSPDFWMNLEMQYQLLQAGKEKNEADIKRRSKIYDLAPVSELIKRCWIRACASIDELEREVCQYYQISSVDEWPQTVANYRVSQDRGPEERAKIAWVRRVEQLATNQPVKEYIPGEMFEFVQRLLSFTQDETNISNIPYLCIENGIHFIIVPHLPKTYLDGAALCVDGHPVIALSLRYDRIDAFWFTFLHELAHIMFQHNEVHLDQLFDRNEHELHNDEIQANQQASKWLIPEEDLEEFIEWNRPRYSRVSIQSFAAKQKCHPGIVIGQLMYRGELKYSHLRKYLVKVRSKLEMWEDVPYPI